MIIIYIMVVIVVSLFAVVLNSSTEPNQTYRRMVGADYDEFKNTIDNYSKAIEVEMGSAMAEFFKGSTYLMLGEKRKARENFYRAKKMGKRISKQTLDLCQ